MKPYYSADGITLFLGDCGEVTAWIEADVLVTDPPYGIGWTRGTYNGADKHAGIKHDATTEVRDDALALWGERPAIVFGDFTLPPARVAQTLVWHKPSDSGIFGARMGWRRDVEAIYLVGTWPQKPAKRSSVLASGQAMSEYTKATGHPHTKPVALMERLVEQTEGVIADPFAGSGSTLVAAKLQGRKAIGVEIEERYAEISARRLDQGVLDFGSAV
jgi:site-specific DNA-methyltransferase (adenine-specific)